jgi:hypothetical protein
MAVKRDQFIDRILRHNPQPLNIKPLNMIAPDEVNSNSHKASEMGPETSASDKDNSESPQQQQPEPEKTTSPPQQQHFVPQPTVPEPSVPEQTSPKQTVPEHIVPEPTSSSTIPLPVQVVKITHYNGVCDMDTDSEDDQDNQSTNMIIDNDSNQPSTP